MNGMVWLSTVRSSRHAARCGVSLIYILQYYCKSVLCAGACRTTPLPAMENTISKERTPHATVCIVLRPTLAGAGDYKELRRISPLSTIRIADVYRKAPCRKYNARRFKSRASSPPTASRPMDDVPSAGGQGTRLWSCCPQKLPPTLPAFGERDGRGSHQSNLQSTGSF